MNQKFQIICNIRITTCFLQACAFLCIFVFLCLCKDKQHALKGRKSQLEGKELQWRMHHHRLWCFLRWGDTYSAGRMSCTAVHQPTSQSLFLRTTSVTRHGRHHLSPASNSTAVPRCKQGSIVRCVGGKYLWRAERDKKPIEVERTVLVLMSAE